MIRTPRTLLYLVPFLAAATGLGAQTFSIRDLGTLGGEQSDANGGINSSCQVAGASNTTAGPVHAFLFNLSTLTMSDLGTLGGLTSRANDLSDSGVVVGKAQTAAASNHAFLYSTGTGMTDLHGKVGLGGTSSSAIAINSAGAIVGWATTVEGAQHAFRYNSVSQVNLDLHAAVSLGGDTSLAYGLNDSGLIVGSATTAAGTLHGFVYDPGSNTLRDLGTPGNADADATSVNNGGVVVGGAENAASVVQAYQTSGAGPLVNLGSLGGPNTHAYAINGAGQVVGSAEISGGAARAFLYDASNGMRNLNSLLPSGSGWLLWQAERISAAGNIVGSGYKNGHDHAFLASVSDSTPPATSASILPLVNPNGYIYSDVTVNLSAADDACGSGPLQLRYSLTGAQTGGPMTVPGGVASLAVSSDGDTTLTFGATDNAGNEETTHSVLLRIAHRPSTVGDVNGDGVNNCADLQIVKTSFGKRSGQAGFDARADVNLDGLVDARDLAYVSQRLSAGTRCQ